MTVIVDASVVVPAALTGTWGRWLADEFKAAPTLLWSETCAVLRQLQYRNEVSARDARAALAWLQGAKIRSIDSSELVGEAFQLAGRLGWAKTYDAEYVVAAQRLGSPLVTVDARLRRSIGTLIAVVGPTGA